MITLTIRKKNFFWSFKNPFVLEADANALHWRESDFSKFETVFNLRRCRVEVRPIGIERKERDRKFAPIEEESEWETSVTLEFNGAHLQLLNPLQKLSVYKCSPAIPTPLADFQSNPIPCLHVIPIFPAFS